MTALDLLRPHTTHSAQQRAWEYVDLVEVLEGSAQSVSADVPGTEVYEVGIRVHGGNLRVFCTCPYFDDRGSACKHLWATAVIATESGWLVDLPDGLRVVMDFDDLEDHQLVIPERGGVETRHPRPSPPPQPEKPPEWAVALAAVRPPAHGHTSPVWAGSQLLYILTAPLRATLTELPLGVEKRERKRDGAWSKPQPLRLTLGAIAQLPDADDRWALSLTHATSSFPQYGGGYGYGLASQPLAIVYLKAALIDLLLPRLCPTGRVRLRQARANALPLSKSENDAPLEWNGGEPWRFRLVIERDDKATPASYRVDAVLCRGERRESVHQFALLTESIAVLGSVAAPFDPAGGFAWVTQLRSCGAILVPAKSRQALIESIAGTTVDHVELPDELQWEERRISPRFCATIGQPSSYSGACPVDVAAEYDGLRTAMDTGSRLISADGRVLYRRDETAERNALATLKRHGVAGLEPHLLQHPSIHARKLPALVDALVAQGWHVDADGIRYRSIQAPRLRISSNIDWFEIDAWDDDGAAVDLPDLAEGAQRGAAHRHARRRHDRHAAGGLAGPRRAGVRARRSQRVGRPLQAVAGGAHRRAARRAAGRGLGRGLRPRARGAAALRWRAGGRGSSNVPRHAARVPARGARLDAVSPRLRLRRLPRRRHGSGQDGDGAGDARGPAARCDARRPAIARRPAAIAAVQLDERSGALRAGTARARFRAGRSARRRERDRGRGSGADDVRHAAPRCPNPQRSRISTTSSSTKRRQSRTRGRPRRRPFACCAPIIGSR